MLTTQKAIEVLTKNERCILSGCPIASPCGGCLYNPSDAESKEAVEMAKEAIEKQIPMKPQKALGMSGRWIWLCGNCGEELSGGEFCKWCGQKIDWGDNNDTD